MTSTTRRALLPLATGLLLLAVLTLVVGRTVAASGSQAGSRVTVHYPFTATVLQGPDRGLSLAGTLQLTIQRPSGYITGRLLPRTGASVPVQGQLHGQLIGLYFNLGKGRNIFGTGMVGYDRYAKKNVLGGTFNGPSDRSTGVWRVVIVGFTYKTGGCIEGLDAGNGSCIIIT